MSLVFEASDLAALTRSSSCLRCCITDWALAWSCQKSGAFIFCSSAVSPVRAEGSSKIAPHELDALLELGVARLQVFNVVRRRHGVILADLAGRFVRPAARCARYRANLVCGGKSQRPYETTIAVLLPICSDLDNIFPREVGTQTESRCATAC